MIRTAWLPVAAITLFWGINWPIMKIGVLDIPIFTFRAIAGGGATIGLCLLARHAGLSLRVPRGQRLGLVVAALLNIFVFNLLMLVGVTMMESGRAAILAYTMPLWAALLGMAVLGDRPTRRQVAGLACGIAGMAVLMVADARAVGAAPLGAFVVLAGSVCWAAGTVAMKYFRLNMPSTAMAAWQQGIAAVPFAVIALLVDRDAWGPASAPAVGALFYNMLVTGILCYWAWFKLVSLVPVVVSAVATLMVPVVGVASGALVLAERPGLDTAVALVLVLGAIGLVLLPGRRPRPAAATSSR